MKYLIVIILVQLIQSAVIGIDFGEYYWKATLISPGKPCSIVENTASGRKSHNSVHFGNEKRVFEGDAWKQKGRYPTKTFNFAYKWLGVKEEDSENIVKMSKEFFEGLVVEYNVDRKTVEFKVKVNQSEEEEVQISIEQIIAMIIKHIRTQALKQTKTQVDDCVITVPAHWNLRQRAAANDAVKIAGMNLIQTTTENVAASLKYLISNYDQNVTQTGLVYNMGANQATATLIKLEKVESTKKKNSTIDVLTILGEVSIPNIGGQFYSQRLTNHFQKLFDEKHRQGKSSITTNGRALNKLFNECDKLKEVLSANKDGHLIIEQLFDNVDFQEKITRENFEALSKDLLDQVTSPIDKVLEQTNSIRSDVDFIELIGGSTTIPKINEILQAYVGERLPLGNHLNLYEAPAFGASYIAANSSSHYRMKEMWLNDGLDYKINMQVATIEDENMKLEEDEKPYFKEITLFPFRKNFKSTRNLQFLQNNNVEIKLQLEDRLGNKVDYQKYRLENITNLRNSTDFEMYGKPKVHLKFELDPVNFVKLKEHELWVNHTVVTKRVKKAPNYAPLLDKEVKKEDGEQKEGEKEAENKETENKETDKETENKETENKESENKETENKESENKESENKETNETEKEGEQTEKKEDGEALKEEIIYKNKTSIQYIPLKLQKAIAFKGMNLTTISEQKKLLDRLEADEARILQIAEAKNKLESFLYQLREFFEDENAQPFYLEENKVETLKKVEEIEEWIYSDEAINANLDHFKEKYKSLTDMIERISYRLTQYNERPLAVNRTLKKIEEYEKKYERLGKSMPWLKESEIQPLREELENTVNWMKKNLEEQAEKPKHEDPVFDVKDFKEKIDKIQNIYSFIRKIKKPEEFKDIKIQTVDGEGKTIEMIKLDGEGKEIKGEVKDGEQKEKPAENNQESSEKPKEEVADEKKDL